MVENHRGLSEMSGGVRPGQIIAASTLAMGIYGFRKGGFWKAVGYSFLGAPLGLTISALLNR